MWSFLGVSVPSRLHRIDRWAALCRRRRIEDRTTTSERLRFVQVCRSEREGGGGAGIGSSDVEGGEGRETVGGGGGGARIMRKVWKVRKPSNVFVR